MCCDVDIIVICLSRQNVTIGINILMWMALSNLNVNKGSGVYNVFCVIYRSRTELRLAHLPVTKWSRDLPESHGAVAGTSTC